MKIFETQDLETCVAIRRDVFIDEQGVSEAIELEGDGAHCLYYLAASDAPVATLRITPKGDVAKIERVAVLPNARGIGIGAALMRYVMADLAAKGFAEALLGSQRSAQPFYDKLGFIAYGKEFLDADIPHIMMKCALKR